MPDEAKASGPDSSDHVGRGDISTHSANVEKQPNAHAGDVMNEKSLVRKLDWRLLPPLTLLYLLSFLDRSNVANARIEGLTDDIHMSGDQYLTGLTLYFIGYVLFEVPCNIVLKRWTPKMWLPTLTLVWGIVSTLMGLTQNYSGFLAVRFFLGVAEAGLFPGIVYYLSMWYQRNERQYRVALFFSAASLAGAFGGILAWGIAHMDGVGGLGGWRWIFILEGLLTVVVSCGAYFFLYNYPDTASFLSSTEKETIQTRLATDSDATNDERFTWDNVLRAFKDPKVYLYTAGFHTLSLPLYTLSLFLPSIIEDLGYSSAQAQLLTIPPYAFATTTTILCAILSERYRRRAPFIASTSAFAIIGYIILLSDPSPGPSYVGTFFAAGGIYPGVALVLAWPANNVSGQTKRAVANAMQISIGNLGAVLGTQLYREETSPRYFLGHSFALGYLAINIVIMGLLWIVLTRENARRDRLSADAAGTSSGSGSEDETEWKGDEDLRWRFYL